MAWEVLNDEDFEEWLRALPADVADSIAAAVLVLATFGPQLGRPKVDAVKGSAFKNMKELRVPAGNAPYRILFAFDPKRRAILLVGGDKGKDKRWYKVNVPIADERFRKHLDRVEKEEKSDG